MANEFKIRKGLIVEGATGGTVVDVQGSLGQLFSVTDNLTGEIFAVSDISGVPIMKVNSSGLSTFAGNININAQILTPGGSNLALNPNTGLVTIGGVLQASGAGASFFTGDLLVGKSSNTIATSGAKIGATTGTNITRSGNEVLYLNRTTNFGKTLSIAKDGTTIGEIGTFSGVPYIGYSQGGGGGIMFNGLSIEPTALGSSRTNNTNDVGSSTYRWKDGWFGGTVTAANFVGGNGAFVPLSGGSGVGQAMTGPLFISTPDNPTLTLENTDNSGDPVITFKSNNPITTEGAQLFYVNNIGTLHITTTFPNVAASIVFNTATGTDQGTNNERMRITGGGNVGIGTTSPNAKLEVASGQAKTVTSGVEFARFGTSNEASNYATLTGEVKGGATAADRKWIFQTIEAGVANAGDIAFQPSGGNVGIGTSNPAQNFVVAEGTDQHGIELAPGTLSYIQAYDRATSDYGDLHIDAQKIGFGLDNGAEKVTFLANGNVGINVTNPFSKLTINGDINLGTNPSATPYLQQGGNMIKWGHEAGHNYCITTNMHAYTNAGGAAYNYNRLQLNWHTGIEIGGAMLYGGTRFFNNSPGGSGVQVMSIADSDSNVRINNSLLIGSGTGSPIKRLHVKNGTSGATNYAVPGIAIENDTNVSLQFLGGAAHQLGITFSDPTTVEAGFIYYNTSTNNLQLQAQNNIIFTQTGNVLIGASSSSAGGKFSVRKDSSTTSFGGNPLIILENLNATDGQVTSIGFRNNNSIGTTSLIDSVAVDHSVGATDLRFSTYSGSAWNDNMVVFSYTGNVGIGTTTPLAKLDIQGTQGQLFSVTDDLSGEIFAVADISGVPIMSIDTVGVSPNNIPLTVIEGEVGINRGSGNAYSLGVGTTSSGAIFAEGKIFTTGRLQGTTAVISSTVRIGGTLAPTSGTTLDVDGTVLIKDSDGVSDLYLGNFATAKFARFHTNNSDTYFDMNCGNILWRQGSGVRYNMNMTSATFTAAGDIIAYGSPSDIRLKENIKPIESALDKVMKLEGVTFNWKESDSVLNIKEDIGFIAQDVKKVLPELVRENEDGMLSMRHQGIAPILLEAIKELKAEIEELKKKIK